MDDQTGTLILDAELSDASDAKETATEQGGYSIDVSEWSKWKAWKEKTNEESAITALQFLKVLCQAYQSALSKAKDQYEEDKKNLNQRNSDTLAMINNMERSDAGSAERDCTAARKALDIEQDMIPGGYYNEMYEFISQNFKHKALLSLASKPFASKLVSEQSVLEKEELQIRAELDKLFNKQRENRDAFRNATIKKLNDAADLDRAKEQNQYMAENKKLQDNFTLLTQSMDMKFKELLNDVMSDTDVGSYIKMVLSSIPSASKYTCSTNIPEYVCFGETSMVITSRSSVHPEVSEQLLNSVPRVIEDVEGQLVARLPYCQGLDEGISLFLNYSPAERSLYQDRLKMLLLRLFMVFPAGKLEATMIDPLELGETFSMFTKLGEEQPRIIDTKIWSQDKDITESIHILRQKLETMTQAYGTDKVTRLKKEPVRVLAITDFPTGFTQSALQDLQAIVRKSASFGVCVFIWANSEEIKKLAASQQPIFNEIKQMLHVATVKGATLELETSKYKGVTLALDNMKEVAENSITLVQKIAKGIHESQRKIEHFIDMFNNIEDPNNWFMENTINELSIPIGIKGASTIVKMVLGKRDGSTEHHALIAGQTGAGKSTLLHTIIMSILLNYSPEEVQLYLVDFKEGVEFKPYTQYNLPALRVVAIDSEREFGLNILKELCKELERRADMFSRDKVEEISDYRRGTKNKIPKIVLIFDEIQELFRERGESDSISKDSLDCLNKLITQGRAMGIHVILACQDFHLATGIEMLFSQIAIRIAIKGSEESARSVLGGDNPGAKQLQDREAGAAIYNGRNGIESANIVFQISYLDKTKRSEFLEKISAYQSNENLSKRYKTKTRILLTNAEDDYFNLFNQLIIDKNVEKIFEDGTKYGLMIGEGFELNRNFKIGMAPVQRSNLLMVGSDEKRAASMFHFMIMSLLYGELTNQSARKDNQLVHLVDLSDDSDYATPDNTSFAHLELLFRKQIKCVRMGEMEELISDTYDTVLRRKAKKEDINERLVLMIFGISRAHRLVAQRNMYEESDSGRLTTINKLHEILKHGAQLGVNCITWGETYNATCNIIGPHAEGDFAHRIVFSTDNETMEKLVMEHNGQKLRSTTAIYMNTDEDVKNTHFRPYEIPAKEWVEMLAKVYHDFE